MIFKEEKFRNTKWVSRSRIVEEGQTIQKTHNVQWNQVLLKSNGSFALVRMNQVVEISDQKFNVKFKII
jgi:hypothetical protein